MPFRTLSALLVSVLLVGCATLNENECRSADWRELGRTDGANGYEATRLGDHVDACGKYGVSPDAAAYRSGREEGLRQYCTPENALQRGIDARGYNAVCPGESGEMFRRIYDRGTVLNQIRSDVNEIQQRLDSDRQVQDQTKDLGAYKMLAQNVRYFENQLNRLQRRYDEAHRDIDAGYDPPYYSPGEWRSGVPYPDAARDAEQHRKDDKSDAGRR